MPTNESPRRTEAAPRRRWLRWLLAAVVVAIVAARIALPVVVGRQIEQALGKALGLPVHIADLDVSLIRGGVTFEGVGVAEHPTTVDAEGASQPLSPDDTFIHWDRLHGNLEWSALLRGQIRLADLVLQGAVIRIEETPDGKLQPLARLLAMESSSSEGTAENTEEVEGPMWPVRIDRLSLRNLRLHVVDPDPDSDPVDFTLEALDLHDLVVDDTHVGFGSIALHGPTLRLDRDFSWFTVTALSSDESTAPTSDEEDVPTPDEAPTGETEAGDVEIAGPPEAGQRFAIDRIDIDRAQFVLLTATRALDAALRLRAKRVSVARGETFPLRLDLAIEEGSLTLKGTVGINPPSFDGTLQWTTLPVPVFVLATSPTLATWVRSCSSSGSFTMKVSLDPETADAGLLTHGRIFVRNLSLADPAVDDIGIDLKELELALGDSRIPLAPTGARPARIAIERLRLDAPRVRYAHPTTALGGPAAAATAAGASGDAPMPPATDTDSQASGSGSADAPADAPEPALAEAAPSDAPGPAGTEAPGNTSATATADLPDQAPQPAVADADTAAPPASVKVSLDSFELNGGQVDFTDNSLSPGQETQVTDLSVKAAKLRWPELEVADVTMSATALDGASISITGDAGSEHADLRIEVDSLALPRISPYLQRATGLVVAQGDASLSSTLQVGLAPAGGGAPPDGGPAPGAVTGVRFDGRVLVSDLSITDPSAEDIAIGWKELDVQFGDSTVPVAGDGETPEPIRIAIEHLRLAAPRVHYTHPPTALRPTESVAPGETTVETPAPAGAGGSDAQPGARQPFQLALGNLSLDHGQIDFTDHTVSPSFDTRIKDLNVKAAALRWPPLAASDVVITGKAPDDATLSVKGDLGTKQSQLDIEIQKLALPPFAPYMKTAMGFIAAKGSASLRSKIQVASPRYEASNKLSLYKLNIDTINPETAQAQLGMPIDLAVALLRDPTGKITLSIPIKGDETGTRTSLRAIMTGALRQALIAAVTSPLKMVGMVGSVVPIPGRGGGLKVDPIESVAGQEDPAPGASERIDALAALLSAQAQLAVSLRGRTGPADRDPMAERILFERLQAGEDLPEIQGTGWLERRRIRKALEARGRGEPVDLDEDDRALYERYLAAVKVPSKRMHQLAEGRAERIRSILVERLGVEPERATVGLPAEPGAPGVVIQLGAAAAG